MEKNHPYYKLLHPYNRSFTAIEPKNISSMHHTELVNKITQKTKHLSMKGALKKKFSILTPPLLFASILPLLLLSGLPSCKNNKEKIKSLKLPAERPSHKSKDLTLLYSDSAKLKALLKSPEMIAYDKNIDEPFIYFPNTLQIIFYNEQQRPTSTLTANQAVYFTKTQKAYLKYNVHFINDKKEHLTTENIVWNQSTGKITSDKPVRVSTPTQIISGTGIECEEDFSNYTIKNITGIIHLNTEEKSLNKINESR